MKLLLATTLIAAIYYGNIESHHGLHGRIGIVYNPANHEIVKVYLNSPAQNAGLHKHDRVKHINDVDITGPAYTYVNLTIQRGDSILVFVIERVPNAEIDTKHEAPEIKRPTIKKIKS